MREIAGSIVVIRFGSVEGVLPCLQPVHWIVCVGGDLILDVGDRQQIAIEIVVKPRNSLARIRNLSHTIEVVIAELSEQSTRIGEADQAADRIVGPLRRVAQWISGCDEIALGIIGKGRWRLG